MWQYRSRRTRLPKKPANDERNSSAGIVDGADGAAEVPAEETRGEVVATTEASVVGGGRARRLASVIEGTVEAAEGPAAVDSETPGFLVAAARPAAVVVDIAIPGVADPGPALGLCRCAQPPPGRPRAPPVWTAAGGPSLDRPVRRLAGAARVPGPAPRCPVEMISSAGGPHAAAPAPCHQTVDRQHPSDVATLPLGAAVVGEA